MIRKWPSIRQVFGQIQGLRPDPAGLEAVWVAKEQVSQAQTLGYTVVDTATVVATHLSQILPTMPPCCWVMTKYNSCST